MVMMLYYLFLTSPRKIEEMNKLTPAKTKGKKHTHTHTHTHTYTQLQPTSK